MLIHYFGINVFYLHLEFVHHSAIKLKHRLYNDDFLEILLKDAPAYGASNKNIVCR